MLRRGGGGVRRMDYSVVRETLGYWQRVMGVVSFHFSLMPRGAWICGPVRRRQRFWCSVVHVARI